MAQDFIIACESPLYVTKFILLGAMKSMKPKNKFNILIVGAGILGIAVASELLSMGFNVTLIFLERNCYLDKVKTKGKINSALIPHGFGGGSNIWSDLSGFICEEEWKLICEKFIENYNYQSS